MDFYLRMLCVDIGWYVDEEDCCSVLVDNWYNDFDIVCLEVGGNSWEILRVMKFWFGFVVV